MKDKIFGIFVSTLLIVATVLPVAGNVNVDNNEIKKSFNLLRDVGVIEIISPTSGPLQTYPVIVKVKNHGDYDEVTDVQVEIIEMPSGTSVYADYMEDVDVPIGQEVVVEFPGWTPSYCIKYNVTSCTLLEDGNLDNNCLSEDVNIGKSVHNIDTGKWYYWIQDSIDDVDTLDGHTIEVYDAELCAHPTGAYVECVTVYKKGLTLRAAVGSHPIIDAAGIGTAVVIEAHTPYVEVSGFTLLYSDTFLGGRGVYIWGFSNHANINNNTIQDFRTGIFMGSDYCSIKDNIIEFNRDGIDTGCGGNDYWVIINNTIAENDVGIKLNEDTNLEILNNNIKNNIWGIGMTGGVGAYCEHNYIFGNNISKNQYGITISNFCKENTIYNNYFHNYDINADDKTVGNKWYIHKTDVVHGEDFNIIGGDFFGGNYWHDYTGIDVNGDGLGNTKVPYNSNGYIINGGDWLPLTFSRSRRKTFLFAEDSWAYLFDITPLNQQLSHSQLLIQLLQRFSGYSNDLSNIQR